MHVSGDVCCVRMHVCMHCVLCMCTCVVYVCVRESDHGCTCMTKDSISKLQVPHNVEDMPGVWHISVNAHL